MISMEAVTFYVLGVAALVCLVFFCVDTIAQVVGAVREARAFYRQHPELEPPDKFLVHLGLWRAR